MVKRLHGQIDPANPGILVDIAQDIGDLQSPAQMMRQGDARLPLHAEHIHRQAPDGTGHPVAIEVECGIIGPADIGIDIHLHAIDHRDEIGLLQRETPNGAGQKCHLASVAAPIQRGNVGPPAIQQPAPLRLRCLLVVGDIVHQPAKAIDGEHRLALRCRQHPHPGIERAARDGGLQGSGIKRRLGGGSRSHAKTLRTPWRATAPSASSPARALL